MNLISKLSFVFLLLAGLAFTFVSPKVSPNSAITSEMNLQKEKQFKAQKKLFISKVTRLQSQAELWLNRTTNPKYYTNNGTIGYQKQVRLVAKYRPIVEKVKEKLYQVQRCVEISFSTAAMAQCSNMFATIDRSTLRSLGKITLDS